MEARWPWSRPGANICFRRARIDRQWAAGFPQEREVREALLREQAAQLIAYNGRNGTRETAKPAPLFALSLRYLWDSFLALS